MDYDFVAHLDPTLEEDKFLWDALGINSSSFQIEWRNGKLIRKKDEFEFSIILVKISLQR